MKIHRVCLLLPVLLDSCVEVIDTNVTQCCIFLNGHTLHWAMLQQFSHAYRCCSIKVLCWVDLLCFRL
jgi:hypothetical protein